MLMRHKNDNMYVYVVSKIKWQETQVIRHGNVVYRTYEGSLQKNVNYEKDFFVNVALSSFCF